MGQVGGGEPALTSCAGRFILESEHWEFEDLEINSLQTICTHMLLGKSSHTPKDMHSPFDSC